MTVVQDRPTIDNGRQLPLGAVLEQDLDLFHVLPLQGLPLDTPALRRARMIKNQNLESQIEVFRDQTAGSGQIAIKELPKQFGEQIQHTNDIKLLLSLGRLNSYDPFSLRISLRDLGLLRDDMLQVQLSEKKQHELERFMQSFTRPLMQQVFGDQSAGIEKFDDIVSIFKNPDASLVRQNLGKLAASLKIEILDIPKFLEDFSDVFLSLSYYRDTIESLEPKLQLLNESLNDLRGSYQFTQDLATAKCCEDTVDRVNRVFVFVTGRLESFAQSTENLWENLTADNFEKVRALISSYHVSIGGMLCMLSVKLDAWALAFPNKESGSPMRRIEFLQSEMRRGIEKIDTIFDETPALANFN